MSDINQNSNLNETNEYITTDQAIKLVRRLEIERQTQREAQYQGAPLWVAILHNLDNSPNYILKEEFKRFKKHIAKYTHEPWTQQEQINKEFIYEIKRHKTDTFQVINKIYRYAKNTRTQARAATEIFEKLILLQQVMVFNNEEQQQIFEGIIDQTCKLATFGYGTTQFQNKKAKGFATKALRLPASRQHIGRIEDEERIINAFDNRFIADLHQAKFQQRLLYNNSNN